MCAKMKQGIFGAISGKVGNLVGSSWKGIAVIKSLPASVANPRTAGQVAQRTKMTNIVDFAQVILSVVIKPLWDRFASQMSGYNAFVSRNIALFAAALPSTFADLITSTGKMASTAIATLVGEDSVKTVTVTWVDDSGVGFKLASDLAYIVLINETTGEVSGFETAADRDDETVIVTTLTEQSEADTLHAYLSFKRVDGTVVSDNSYLTDAVPA
jgi:hypothetical protein